jgi:hypothetical protein
MYKHVHGITRNRYLLPSRVTEIRNRSGVKILDVSADATLIIHNHGRCRSASRHRSWYQHSCDRDDIVKAVVTSDLDVTAISRPRPRPSDHHGGPPALRTAFATSVTIDAPQVNLTGDLALENVVANVSVTSPLVNATTKLVTPVIGSSIQPSTILPCRRTR